MRYYLSVIAAFLTVSVVVGCTGPKQKPHVISAETKINVTADGLGVRTITIDPNGGALAEQLEMFGEPISDLPLASELLAEGLHVRRIHTSEVAAIIDSIGTASEDDFVWHGQVVNWRDIHQRLIPQEGVHMELGGTSYYVDSGFLSLLARSWLVEHEDGLFVYVQVLPTWHVPSRRISVVGKAKKPSRRNVFTNLMIETLLKDEEALLLGVVLSSSASDTGPHNDGASEVLLGQALMGAPMSDEKVVLLIMQANIQSME